MWQNEIKYKALTKQPLHALQLLFENCTSFLTKQLFYSDSLQLLEEVSKDLGIDEAWIDLMVENWEVILGSKDTMRKLPVILSVLSESVVSSELFEQVEESKRAKHFITITGYLCFARTGHQNCGRKY